MDVGAHEAANSRSTRLISDLALHGGTGDHPPILWWLYTGARRVSFSHWMRAGACPCGSSVARSALFCLATRRSVLSRVARTARSARSPREGLYTSSASNGLSLSGAGSPFRAEQPLDHVREVREQPRLCPASRVGPHVPEPNHVVLPGVEAWSRSVLVDPPTKLRIHGQVRQALDPFRSPARTEKEIPRVLLVALFLCWWSPRAECSVRIEFMSIS